MEEVGAFINAHLLPHGDGHNGDGGGPHSIELGPLELSLRRDSVAEDADVAAEQAHARDGAPQHHDHLHWHEGTLQRDMSCVASCC